MKVGMRKPSLKKSFKARTTGRVKRKVKRTINPFYGKKGVGFIKNPKRAVYNKVYRKTTFSPFSIGKGLGGLLVGVIVLPFWLIYIFIKAPISLLKAVLSNGDRTKGNIKDDDYAKAVFLWANSKPSPIKDDSEYQGYLRTECGITQPSAYHEELVTQGYFRTSTVEERLHQLTVTELKGILDELALPKSGKKDELIVRVTQNADIDVINRYCKESYSISDLGRTFVDEHMDYINQHKSASAQI